MKVWTYHLRSQHMEVIHHCHFNINTFPAGQNAPSDQTSRGDSGAKENQTSEACRRYFLQSAMQEPVLWEMFNYNELHHSQRFNIVFLRVLLLQK